MPRRCSDWRTASAGQQHPRLVVLKQLFSDHERVDIVFSQSAIVFRELDSQGIRNAGDKISIASYGSDIQNLDLAPARLRKPRYIPLVHGAWIDGNFLGVFEHRFILGIQLCVAKIVGNRHHDFVISIDLFTEKLSVCDGSIAALEQRSDQDGDHLFPLYSKA